MKRTITTCDVCGKEIPHADIKYKFKKYELTYENYDCWTQWYKLDMCENCYKEFLKFVNRKAAKTQSRNRGLYSRSSTKNTYTKRRKALKSSASRVTTEQSIPPQWDFGASTATAGTG